MGLCAVDALGSLNHIIRKSDWKFPVGAGPLAMPEALRISGKHLQTPAFRFARRTPAELLGHDVIRPIRLRGPQDFYAHGPRHQISHLQAGRVRHLGNHHQFKRERLIERIRPGAKRLDWAGSSLFLKVCTTKLREQADGGRLGLRSRWEKPGEVCVPAHIEMVSSVNAMMGILVDDCGADFLLQELHQVVLPLQELNDLLKPAQRNNHARQRLPANRNGGVSEA